MMMLLRYKYLKAHETWDGMCAGGRQLNMMMLCGDYLSSPVKEVEGTNSRRSLEAVECCVVCASRTVRIRYRA